LIYSSLRIKNAAQQDETNEIRNEIQSIKAKQTSLVEGPNWPGWAKYIAMAGLPIRGDQAKAIGLVHHVFPAEAFVLAKLSVYLFEDVSDRNANAISIASLTQAYPALQMIRVSPSAFENE
jgi:hypothetical protein